MTATQKFLQDAVSGGWHHTGEGVHEILLSALAWQAVGKTRGWYITTKPCNHSDNYHGTCMRCAWHRFIDHLADGKSIEEALAKTDVTTGG